MEQRYSGGQELGQTLKILDSMIMPGYYPIFTVNCGTSLSMALLKIPSRCKYFNLEVGVVYNAGSREAIDSLFQL